MLSAEKKSCAKWSLFLFFFFRLGAPRQNLWMPFATISTKYLVNFAIPDSAPRLGHPLSEEPRLNMRGKTGSVMSEKEAQSLFKEMQSHSEMAFDFLSTDVLMRAHEMSRLMIGKESFLLKHGSL